jgi:hydroxymethylpyrimidine/phosphomethylpyrimidine kinase
MKVVLTIAGSDSIAGAGIQADLKTFAALGVYGTSAVTAVTSQDTTGVSDIFAIPPHVVRSQIERVARDVPLAAVKTGMLVTAEIVRVVAETVRPFPRLTLVVDPVMVASSLRTLLSAEAVGVMKSELLPIAAVVTPNISEAAALAGIEVASSAAVREAAKRIFDLGPGAVIVKGGHMTGPEAIDLLYDGHTFTEFTAPRLRLTGGPVHGTGCTFASAIAAGLALGDDLPNAVDRAKRYVTGAIEHASAIGQGARLLDHFWHFWNRGYTQT